MIKRHVTVKAEAVLAAPSFALALTTWAEAQPSVASPLAPLSNVVLSPHDRSDRQSARLFAGRLAESD